MATIECAEIAVQPGAAEMTAADLIEHRLRELEETVAALTGTVQSLRRETDRLAIEQAGAAGAVAKLEGKFEALVENLQRSLARLHDRLDERLKDVAPIADLAELKADFTKAREAELREEGAKVMRAQLRRFWFSITAAAAAVGGVLLALIGQISG